jgi:raffinose/stachyose/melibiose transport system permease protein
VTTAHTSARNAVGASPAAAPLRKQRGGGPALRGKGSGLADWIGVGPTMVLFCLFIIVPMIIAVALSFVTWNGVGSPAWAGFANWTQFFRDPVAHSSVWITLQVVVLSYVIQTPISIGLGLFTAGKQRYRAVYAAIFVLPLLLSTAGISLTWSSMLDPSFGAIVSLANSWHLRFLNQDWLGSSTITLYVLIFIIAWQFIPFHTLLYAVGRRQIPATLYEAARIDGATPAQMFWNVTLPQLRYTLVTSGILMVVGSLTYFDIIYILTQGGPGTSTMVLSLYMYTSAFKATEFGYASVLAVVLGVVGILVAVGLVRFTGFGRMQSQQEGVA